MCLISGRSNEPLASQIAKLAGEKLVDIEIKQFADKEIFVRIKENIRGNDCFIIQSTSNPANQHIMELLLIIDALKRASAQRIVAVIPYFGYARQDRKVEPRVPISAKVCADIIQTVGAHRVLTMDIHAGQIQGFFNIPVDNLFPTHVQVDFFSQFKGSNDAVVVSPDVGGVGRARFLAKWLELPIAIVDKRREVHNEAIITNLIGNVKGKTCIIIDDIVDTGGTLIGSVELLKEKGAGEIYVTCSHPVLSNDAKTRIMESPIKKFITTDTIHHEDLPSKFEVRSVAELFKEAIMRTHDDQSVSSLFLEKRGT